MHHSTTAALLLLAIGGSTTVLADSYDLFSAEWSERRLEKNPRDEGARAGIVESRLKAGDLVRAEKALADWEAKVPKPAPSLDRLRGETAFARDKIPEAVSAWLRYLKAEPKDWESRVRLAQAYERQGEWQKAVQEYSIVSKSNPSAEIFAQRAIGHVRLHDWAAAEADVKKADQLDATNSSARSLLPLFERSRDWQPQVRKLDAEIAKKPDDVNLRLDRAEWLIGIGFHDAGLDDVKEALKLDPKSLRAQIWNGVLAWERGAPPDAGDVMELRFDKFTNEFRTGLRTIDANREAEARARFLVDHKQPLLALAEVRDSADSPAKAQALYQLDRLPEAGIAARNAVKAHPENADAWLTRARLELQNGNIPEAIDAANRSRKIKRSPEAEELRATATLRLGKK
jgi:tetratricopeptide (TPR) repeat protein